MKIQSLHYETFLPAARLVVVSGLRSPGRGADFDRRSECGTGGRDFPRPAEIDSRGCRLFQPGPLQGRTGGDPEGAQLPGDKGRLAGIAHLVQRFVDRRVGR